MVSVSVVIVCTALAAGLVQGLTGFGSGIVFMAVMPAFLPLITSAGLSNFMCLFLSSSMAFHYRKSIQWKILFLPLLSFILAGYFTLRLVSSLDVHFMKLLFSLFLIALAFYFSFFSTRIHIHPTPAFMICCGGLSGICDGLFAVGGPFMVLLFLAMLEDKEEYLGTIQCFFFISGLFNFILRLSMGLFTLADLPLGMLAACSIVFGLQIANHLVAHLSSNAIRHSAYGFIGISGLLTFLTSI